MIDFKTDKWEESYSRKENFIYYPKEEVVKFVNRYVKKRTGYNSFASLLDGTGKLKALDLGCGVGRQTILFEEFGLEGYGVDISSNAINEATALSRHLGYDMTDRFVLLTDTRLPFPDNYFHLAISDSVLDSMEYDFAKEYMQELNRAVTQLVYLNLISGRSYNGTDDFAEDVLVEGKHEKGTIQSYYNRERIEDLISDTEFKIKDINLTRVHNLTSNRETSRYHVVLSK